MAKASLQNLVKLPALGRKRRSRGPSQSTGLVVEGQTLRVVQALSSGGHVTLQRIASASLELPPDADASDPGVLGPAIARALGRLAIKPGSVVMGLPRAQVVLRTLTLPVIDDVRELASMVHLQVSKDLPFRMDEAVVDFKVRRKILPPVPRVDGDAKPEVDAPPPKLEVLVAAAKRSLVESVEQTAASAGLKLCALGLLPYANVRALDAFKLVEDEQAVALVSLRSNEANIDVIAQQTLLFSRGASVKFPAEAPSAAGESAAKPEVPSPTAETNAVAPKAETVADAVTIEVVRSLHAFSGTEPNRSVVRVAVSGATGHEDAVVAAIAKRVGRPCTLLDPATVFEVPADAREHAPGALPAIGLALGCGDESGLPFDFLNPKQPAVQRDMRRIRILAGVAAAVALVIFTAGIRQYLINRHKKVLTQLQAQFENENKQRKTFQAMVRNASQVKDWTEGGRNWLDHYAYLSAVLPASEEVYITSLAISGTGLLRLSVQARSGETLAKLDKQLRAAGYEVKPFAINPGADRHGYEFRSTVELIIPSKFAIDLSKVKTPARPSDDVSLEPAFNKGGGG